MTGQPRRPDLPARVEDLAARFTVVPDEPPSPRETDYERKRRCDWSLAIPSRFAWAAIADVTDPAIAADLTRWAHPDCADNLVLIGATGTGKTHSAIAAARLKFDLGLDVFFASSSKILRNLRPDAVDRHTIEDLVAVDLLVIDDAGAETPSTWTQEQMFSIIDERWVEDLPTVVTTNLPPKALRETIGAKAYSRLCAPPAVVLGMDGNDRRFDSAGGL